MSTAETPKCWEVHYYCWRSQLLLQAPTDWRKFQLLLEITTNAGSNRLTKILITVRDHNLCRLQPTDENSNCCWRSQLMQAPTDWGKFQLLLEITTNAGSNRLTKILITAGDHNQCRLQPTDENSNCCWRSQLMQAPTDWRKFQLLLEIPIITGSPKYSGSTQVLQKFSIIIRAVNYC